jgi:multiple sugar transport system ATP-binding protein
VTHDQVEAMTLADRVVVMNHGRIEQVGAPNDLYHNPKTRFVAGFIGSPAMNFIPATLEEAGGRLSVRLTDQLSLPLPDARSARYKAVQGRSKVLLGLRPEHITETRQHMEPGFVPFKAALDVTEPMGMETLVYFAVDGVAASARVNPNAGAVAMRPMKLRADLNNMHLIDDSTGKVL